jgi:cytoskeletal protein CcmA (bactofilin family)
MKGKVVTIIAAVVTAGLLLTGTMVAASSDKDDMWSGNKTLKESEVVDGSYYAAGQTVTVAGTVKGDVYCAGKNVTVSGTVEGDVLCAGQTVKVSGEVAGDVRLAGQSVTLDGTVGKSASLAGSTVDVTKSAKIGQDMTVAGESVNVDGSVERDVVAAGNTVVASGIIGRNVEAASESLTISEGSSVKGNLHYTSKNQATIAEGSVAGKVDYTKAAAKKQSTGLASIMGMTVVYMSLAMLFMALVLVLAAPQVLNNLSHVAMKRPGTTTLAGFVTILLVPLVGILFAVTVIGTPIAIVLGLAWLLVLLLGSPVAAYLLGRLIIRNYSSNAIVSMLVGTAVILVLYLIPVINVLVAIAATVAGVGMITLRILSSADQKKFSYTVK